MMAKRQVKITPKTRVAAKGRQKKGGYSAFFFMMTTVGGMAVISPQTAATFVVCVMPTFMLMFKSSDGLQTLRAQCVGFANVGASLPYLMMVFNKERNFFELATDVEMILFTWGVAAIATIMQILAPHISAAFLQMSANDRLKKIKKQQAQLIEEWGEGVSSN